MQIHNFGRCLFLVILFTFSSCLEDQEQPTLPANESRVDIQNAVASFEIDVQELTSTSAFETLDRFFQLLALDNNIFSRLERTEQQELLRDKIDQLKQAFIPVRALERDANARYDFTLSRGVYNWVAAQQRFVNVGTSQFVVLNFPAPGSLTNNATFTLSNYEDIELSYNGNTFYEPTEIDANIVIDNVQLVDFRFRCIYNTIGLPRQLDFDLFIDPYRLNLDYDDLDNGFTRFDAVITRNNERVMASGVNIDYPDSTKVDIDFMEGFLQYRNITMRGSVDMSVLDTLPDVDYNNFIEWRIFNREALLGDVIFIYEPVENSGVVYDDWVPYVQYANDSLQLVEELYLPMDDELENLDNRTADWNWNIL